MNLPPLILASASPRRQELLRQMGLAFQIVPTPAREVQPGHLSPAEICQINAFRKARAVAARYPDSLVLGADTLVCLGARLFGKPANLGAARKMLSELQGREHVVITGVCLLHGRKRRHKLFADTTRVRFRPLGPAQIREYLARVNPLDKAGAYAIQEQGDRIVERIEGSYSNVVGLPVERLAEELKQWINL
jgi:septum formation protein